jgi:hypothetical protein
MTATQQPPDLLHELGLDAQNHAALGRVLGTGSIERATERADGTMEATIRIKVAATTLELPQLLAGVGVERDELAGRPGGPDGRQLCPPRLLQPVLQALHGRVGKATAHRHA